MPLTISGMYPVNLSELHDVSIAAPQSGQYLRYNGSLWQNSGMDSDVYNYLDTSLNSTDGITLTKLSGPSTITIGLNTLISAPGTFGSSTGIPVITVNAHGRITAITTVDNNPVAGVTNSINTAFGNNALFTNPAGAATGIGNTGIGVSSLYSNDTGSENTAVGDQTLKLNTNGTHNTAVGASALLSNSAGMFNSAFGAYALLENDAGSSNAAIGTRSMQSNVAGSNNSALGVDSLFANTDGAFNVAVGNTALYNNINGSYNTVIGVNAKYSSTSGSNNVLIGYNAGSALGNGNANVIIGGNTGASIIGAGSHYIIISDGDGNEWVVMDPLTSTATFYSSLEVTGVITGNVVGNSTTATTLTTGRTFSLSADATGTSVSFNGSADVTIPMTLATVNSSPQTDTFRKITVNGKGLVTATSVVTPADITGALGYTPVNRAGDTMTGALILSADPTSAMGAVTKQYADGIASGVNIHAACETSTTAALPSCIYSNGAAGVGATLTATLNGVLGVVGGYAALAVASRILVKDQVAELQNGIYVVTSLGSASTPWILTRASDFDGSPTFELQAGDLTYIQRGILNGTQWVETAIGTGIPGNYIVVGTDALRFTQFSGAGTYVAGTGISVLGNTISNTGVLNLTTNTGLSTNVSATGDVTVTNTGVTSIVAGANISISNSTGAVTISTTGTVPTSTVAATTTITDDVSTAIVVYPTWVSADSGNMQQRVSSTRLQFVPSTGVLTSTGFAGSGAGLTSIPNSALTNSSLTIGTTNIALGSSSTTLDGLTSVTSTAFVGALSGNATTATSAINATTSTNIAGGTAGNIHYQSAANTTVLLTTGTSNQVLVSGLTPAWTNTPALTGTNFSSIPNSALTNSSLTIGSTAISLGTSSTILAGLTSVTSTTFTGSGAGLTSIPNSALVGSGSFALGATGIALGSTILNVTGLTLLSATTVSGTLSTAAQPNINSLGTLTSLTVSGTATATSFNATSTKRVKKSIKNLSKIYLDKFSKLRPREYDRKDYTAHEFGFIAEEMAIVYPEVVGRDAAGIPSGIDYGKLSAILTAKVQEQQTIIEKLQLQMTAVLKALKV